MDLDYEFKILSIFAIRHQSSIRSSSARTRSLVLRIPALMLALAVIGTIALVWLLGPKFHL